MSTSRFRVTYYSTAAVALLMLCTAAPAPLEAQTPSVYFACYVPLTGTVYRIKDGNLKTACTPGHVEFSWTDGANAVRTTDALGGDLSGVFANANVVRLLGRALSTTPPQPGQVLTWNGTAWVATTPSQGSTGGVSGREVVHELRTFSALGLHAVQVTCPQGKTALSSGYNVDIYGLAVISIYPRSSMVTSRPSLTDARVWEFQVYHYDIFPIDWDFYVVCVNGS